MPKSDFQKIVFSVAVAQAGKIRKENPNLTVAEATKKLGRPRKLARLVPSMTPSRLPRKKLLKRNLPKKVKPRNKALIALGAKRLELLKRFIQFWYSISFNLFCRKPGIRLEVQPAMIFNFRNRYPTNRIK